MVLLAALLLAASPTPCDSILSEVDVREACGVSLSGSVIASGSDTPCAKNFSLTPNTGVVSIALRGAKEYESFTSKAPNLAEHRVVDGLGERATFKSTKYGATTIRSFTFVRGERTAIVMEAADVELCSEEGLRALATLVDERLQKAKTPPPARKKEKK